MPKMWRARRINKAQILLFQRVQKMWKLRLSPEPIMEKLENIDQDDRYQYQINREMLNLFR